MSPSATARPTPTPVYPVQASSSSSWLAPTPPPSASVPSSSSLKRRRRRKNAEVFAPRETIVDPDAIAKAKNDCEVFSGNDVISCFPAAGDTFPQHEWATFVWNTQRPQLAYTNLVNIYLVQAFSNTPIHTWLNLPNNRQQAGTVTYMVNDTWWGDQGKEWNGSDVNWPMYWAISPASESFEDGSIIPQPTFTAVQTTYADFVVASMSSASVASVESAASASAASASLSLFSETQTLTSDGATHTVVIVGGSGASRTSTFATLTQSPSATSSGDPGVPGGLQSGAGGSQFPHWAIAVIVILGVLAIVAGGIAAWLIMRRLRQRRAHSARTSTNSGTPMLDPHTGGGDVHAPLMAEAGAGAGLAAAAAVAAHHHHKGGDKSIAGDGASTISHAHSEAAPFSGADAAIMADAFRKALRKPGQFTDGDTPDSAKDRREAELLGAELATEGRDLRSVGSSRDVRVQSASDAGHDDRSTFEEHTAHLS